MAKKSVVVIGGGTGTHALLRGLTAHQTDVSITAIVTMADSGGSTGRLRDEFGQLPVGDARMALVALASTTGAQDNLLRQLFMHRFTKGAGLEGHNVGNLLLVALTDILGSEEAAIRAAAEVLRVQGKVVPVSVEHTHLVATYSDGVTVVGEHEIDEPSPDRFLHAITKLAVTPMVAVNPNAAAAIAAADIIVLGPGDLYTSIIANCVVGGVPKAIQQSSAPLVYVSNLMTRRGQTSGYGAAEHAAEVASYLGRTPDVVLAQQGEMPAELLARYASQEEYPVVMNCVPGAYKVVAADFTAKEAVKLQSGDVLQRSLIRHDSAKLASVVLEILNRSSSS